MEINRRDLIKGSAAMMAMGGLSLPSYALGDDHLPSWNDGPAKNAIVNFVKTTTDKNQLPSSCSRRTASRPSTRTARCGLSTPSTRRCCLRSIESANLAPQHPDWKTDPAIQRHTHRRQRSNGEVHLERHRSHRHGNPHRYDARRYSRRS